MARPVVSDTAEDLYASLGAYTVGDEDQDWDLLNVCEAVATAFTEPVAELVSERNGRVSWQVLFDPALCPVEYLPYLAQFTGSTLVDSMSEAEKRAAIELPEGWSRGTPAAMRQAIGRTLTGSKHIYMDERAGGSAYALTIRTQTAETPSATATEAAAVSQKPVGVVLDFAAITGRTYAELDADFADYAAVEAGNADYAEVLLLV